VYVFVLVKGREEKEKTDDNTHLHTYTLGKFILLLTLSSLEPSSDRVRES